MRPDDRGAALIELALVAPLLIGLALGLVEMGALWREQNLLIRDAQAAARAGAGLGPQRAADRSVLQSLQASLAGMVDDDVERVVIYRASDAEGGVPPTCRDRHLTDDLSAKGDATELCNIYSRAQLAALDAAPVAFAGGDACVQGSWDAAWCPTSRNRAGDTVEPDYVGVYVRMRHRSVTGLPGTAALTFSAAQVFRVEPCVSGVSCG